MMWQEFWWRVVRFTDGRLSADFAKEKMLDGRWGIAKICSFNLNQSHPLYWCWSYVQMCQTFWIKMATNFPFLEIPQWGASCHPISLSLCKIARQLEYAFYEGCMHACMDTWTEGIPIFLATGLVGDNNVLIMLAMTRMSNVTFQFAPVCD